MFKTAYKLGGDEELATVNNEDSLTNQADAQDCDINIIVKKYGITGQIPQITGLEPLYGDFTEIGDYHEMVQRIRQANDAFMTIPAEIREQFDNDPGRFVSFASDEKNIEKLREWKLATPKEAQNGTRETTGTDAAGHRNEQSGSSGSSSSRLPEGSRDQQLREGRPPEG